MSPDIAATTRAGCKSGWSGFLFDKHIKVLGIKRKFLTDMCVQRSKKTLKRNAANMDPFLNSRFLAQLELAVALALARFTSSMETSNRPRKRSKRSLVVNSQGGQWLLPNCPRKASTWKLGELTHSQGRNRVVFHTWRRLPFTIP